MHIERDMNASDRQRLKGVSLQMRLYRFVSTFHTLGPEIPAFPYSLASGVLRSVLDAGNERAVINERAFSCGKSYR